MDDPGPGASGDLEAALTERTVSSAFAEHDGPLPLLALRTPVPPGSSSGDHLTAAPAADDGTPLWAKLAGMSWGLGPWWNAWCVVYAVGVWGFTLAVFGFVFSQPHVSSTLGVFTVVSPDPPAVLGALQVPGRRARALR